VTRARRKGCSDLAADPADVSFRLLGH